MVVNVASPELMGLFGLTWAEKVASFMDARLSGSAKKKMHDITQSGGMNIKLVDNLYNEYIALLARGNQPAQFVIAPDSKGNGGDFTSNSLMLADAIGGKTNVESSIVLNFLRAMFVLARDGKIPFERWNPAGYQQTTELRKTFATERKPSGIAQVITGATNTSKVIAVIAGLGVAGYLLSQLKQFK